MMKKFVLFFLCLLCGVAIQAQETKTVSVTFSEKGYSNAQTMTEVIVDDAITITFANNGGSTTPKYYDTGTAIRLYSLNSMTVTAKGATINSVEMTTGAGDYAIDKSTCTVSSGTLSVSGTSASIKGIEAESITFARTNTSGHFRIVSLTVTYAMNAGEEPGVQAVSTPTLPESCNFTESMVVSLSCDTGGATIYYTVDGTEPTRESEVYADSFTITQTTTVKAMAVKEGMNDSEVVEVTYTMVEASSWSLVTDAANLAVNDRVVLVSSVSDYAMSTNQKSDNRGAVEIAKTGDGLIVNDEVQILTLEEGTKTGTFAFNTGSGYLYAASSSNNYLRTKATKDAEGSWEITIADGVASIVAQGNNTRNVMQYNQPYTLFSCYASASQKPICIYKEIPEGTAEEAFEVKINKYGYATLFLDKAVAVPEGLTAYYCTVDGTTAVLNEVGEVIPAATGVVLKGVPNTTYTLTNTAEVNGKAEKIKVENRLMGYVVDTNVPMGTDAYYYALNVKNGMVGFFVPQTVSEDGLTFTAKANKAYLKLEGADKVQMLSIRQGTDGDETAVENSLVLPKTEEMVYYDLTGRRVYNPGRGIYIVNGKKMILR